MKVHETDAHEMLGTINCVLCFVFLGVIVVCLIALYMKVLVRIPKYTRKSTCLLLMELWHTITKERAGKGGWCGLLTQQEMGRNDDWNKRLLWKIPLGAFLHETAETTSHTTTHY